MPSRQHELIAWAVPRLRKSRDLDTVEEERTRLTRWHAQLDRSLPTGVVPRFSRRFAVVTETLTGPSGEFPAYVVTPRGIDPERTVVLVHGGGFVAPLDPFHVRYATRLATALRETAGAIPDAHLRVYEGSGHGLPKRHAARMQADALSFLSSRA